MFNVDYLLDAPVYNHYIVINSKKYVPIIHSFREFDLSFSDYLFTYLKFKLLHIDEEENVVYENNYPVLLNPKEEQEFFKQIGNNTQYIIHPEEILAENFVSLITKNNVETQSIIDSMSLILKS